MSNKLGAMILDISNNIGSKPNFKGYSYLQEMKDLGIEYCLRYAHNYKPEMREEKNLNHAPFYFLYKHISNGMIQYLTSQKKRHINEKMYEDSVLINSSISHNELGKKVYNYSNLEDKEGCNDDKSICENELIEMIKNDTDYKDSDFVNISELL